MKKNDKAQNKLWNMRVGIYLNRNLWLWLRNKADQEGVSDSAYIRRLLNSEMKKEAIHD